MPNVDTSDKAVLQLREVSFYRPSNSEKLFFWVPKPSVRWSRLWELLETDSLSFFAVRLTFCHDCSPLMRETWAGVRCSLSLLIVRSCPKHKSTVAKHPRYCWTRIPLRSPRAEEVESSQFPVIVGELFNGLRGRTLCRLPSNGRARTGPVSRDGLRRIRPCGSQRSIHMARVCLAVPLGSPLVYVFFVGRSTGQESGERENDPPSRSPLPQCLKDG